MIQEMREILRVKTVGIAGCGGLGSNAAVALARAGIGSLIIADFDIVEESNLDRQYYFRDDIGKFKVDALAKHLKNINPAVDVISHNIELTQENVPKIFGDADILIEAFDEANSKKWLIEIWTKLFPEKPIICGNGIAGYGNTNKLEVIRMGKIYFCGDNETDSSIGLCSARVAIVANMQANVAIEILMEQDK